MSRKFLSRPRPAKVRRHLFDVRKEQEEGSEQNGRLETGPLAVEDMADQDRALIESPMAGKIWSWLAERYPKIRLTPDSSLQLDLGVDSLEWLDMTLEVRERFGVELDEEEIGRIGTVRDLLQHFGEHAGTPHPPPSDPLERPEEVLSPEQKRFLNPQGWLLSALAKVLFGLNRGVARTIFRVRASGAEQLRVGQVLLAPNHVSYLDPFVLAAVLDDRVLERTFWAGWAGAAFHNPLNRLVSRLAKTVPIDSRGKVGVSLALAAAVLGRGHNLVWFPEGRRSPEGTLLPFRQGIGLLLSRYDVPVAPVFISGTEQAMPVGRAIPRPAKVTVRFGPMVTAEELAREGKGEGRRERIVDALHARVAKLGEDRPAARG